MITHVIQRYYYAFQSDLFLFTYRLRAIGYFCYFDKMTVISRTIADMASAEQSYIPFRAQTCYS